MLRVCQNLDYTRSRAKRDSILFRFSIFASRFVGSSWVRLEPFCGKMTTRREEDEEEEKSENGEKVSRTLAGEGCSRDTVDGSV